MSKKEPIGHQPCPVLYTVSSPPRGLLDREKDQRNIDKVPTKALTNEKKRGRVQETDQQSRCPAGTRTRVAQRGVLAREGLVER